MVRGPGYRAGLLARVSTRQAGMVVLTDLAPTVLGWRGQPRPAGLPGAPITAAGRGAAGVRGPRADRPGHRRPGVGGHAHRLFLGLRRGWTWPCSPGSGCCCGGLSRAGGGAGRGGGGWRAPSPGAVPAGSFLANVVPWWRLGHPAVWQYGLAVAVDGGGRRDGAGRAVAAGPVRAAGCGGGGDGADRRAGRDDRVPAAAGRAVRPVGAGRRPVLRDRRGRDRPVRRLRHDRDRLGGPTRCSGPAPGAGRCRRVRGRAVRGDRVRLAAVRREGRRHDRHRPLCPAAAHGDGRDQDHGPPGHGGAGQRGGPVRRVRGDQLPHPGHRAIRYRRVRREPVPRPVRRAADAQADLHARLHRAEPGGPARSSSWSG